MKEITSIMIRDFKLMKTGIDFMGYKIDKKQSLSFHHLIISHRDCRELNMGEGYWYWNGAILMQRTAHEYLHLIECKDIEIFNLITSEMVDINVKGYLDKENIDKIDDLLKCFEKEYSTSKNKKGKYLIKEEYIKRGIK